MKKFVSFCACCVRDEGNRVTSLEHFYPKKRRKREREGGTHAFWRGAEVCCLDCRRQADERQAEGRSVRGIASQGQGDTDLWRGMFSERGAVSCYVPRAARSFAFGELAHIEALAFCVRAPRVHMLSGSWRTSRRLRFASKQRACRSSGQWQTTA